MAERVKIAFTDERDRLKERNEMISFSLGSVNFLDQSQRKENQTQRTHSSLMQTKYYFRLQNLSF